MTEQPQTDITRTPHRYELRLDGELAAFADYVVRATNPQVIELPHTVTDPNFRGQGLAAVLVEHILDECEAEQTKVIPSCSYVAHFIERHPQYQHLLAE